MIDFNTQVEHDEDVFYTKKRGEKNPHKAVSIYYTIVCDLNIWWTYRHDQLTNKYCRGVRALQRKIDSVFGLAEQKTREMHSCCDSFFIFETPLQPGDTSAHQLIWLCSLERGRPTYLIWLHTTISWFMSFSCVLTCSILLYFSVRWRSGGRW